MQNAVRLRSGSHPGRQEMNDISIATPNKIQLNKKPTADHRIPGTKAHPIGSPKKNTKISIAVLMMPKAKAEPSERNHEHRPKD